MIKRAILVAAICFLALSSPVGAQDEGTITGKVTNATPDTESSVADLEVTLVTYVNGTEEEDGTTDTTDAEGNFEFSGLATASEYSYEVKLDYQGAEYFSETITFAEGEPSQTADITVWDATTSDEDILVEEAHIFVYPEEGTLRVQEYFWVWNSGDRTYVGSEPIDDELFETLRFSLPEDATDVEYLMGLMDCCAISSEDEIVDTMAVFPADSPTWFAFGYSVESGSSYSLSWVVHYPVSVFNLLVEATGVEVASDQLESQGSVEWEDSEFILLQGLNLDRGTTVVAQLSNLTRTDIQGMFKWAALGLLVLAVGLGLGYPRMRKRLLTAAPEPTTERSVLLERQRLLQELADLDDRFEAGAISRDEYQRLRSQKKARLTGLMRKRPEK